MFGICHVISQPVTQFPPSEHAPMNIDQFITHLKRSVEDRPLNGHTDRRLKPIKSNYIQDVSKILGQFADSVSLLLHVALICMETDLTRAEALLRKVLTLDKENITARIFLAQALLVKGTPEGQLEIIDLIDTRSRGSNQEKSVLEALKGYYNFETKEDFQNAHLAYLNANNHAPTKLAYFRLGRIFEKVHKDVAMAIEFYSSAIVCDSTLVDAYVALYNLYRTQDKSVCAKNALDAARLHHDESQEKMNGAYKVAWEDMDKRIKQLQL